jgi:tRNA(fMet)-specific endonuclease VapC
VSLPRTLLLDTNILIHLVRANWIARSIESRFQLRTRTETPLVSVISIGEALAFAKRLGWGLQKAELLEALLQELVIVDISDEILRAYAEIDFFLRRAGNPIQNNDVWIAATAVAAGAHLLTTDKDFDPLDPLYLSRTWIDPLRPDRESQ